MYRDKDGLESSFSSHIDWATTIVLPFGDPYIIWVYSSKQNDHFKMSYSLFHLFNTFNHNNSRSNKSFGGGF